jgi:hypothetical protein
MWPRGVPLRKEMKRKLRAARLGKPLSARTRAAMSAAHQTSLVIGADAAMRSPRHGGRHGR